MAKVVQRNERIYRRQTISICREIMGTKATHSRTQGGIKAMMINFSYYELDDLLEIREALEEAIKKKTAEDMNLAYQQEDMQLEEQMEEWRDETLSI
jgi:hypothetical protein